MYSPIALSDYAAPEYSPISQSNWLRSNISFGDLFATMNGSEALANPGSCYYSISFALNYPICCPFIILDFIGDYNWSALSEFV